MEKLIDQNERFDSMSIVLKRLSPAIGAVIEGVDIAAGVSESVQQQLHAALVEHQVLFFRNQSITPKQQYEFARRFGDLHIHPIYPQSEEVPEILILDSHRNNLNDNAIWHTDVTFIKTPPLGCVLSAKQVPEFGGDTLWSSGFSAWEGLSNRLQELLDGLTATHEFTRSFPVERYGNTPDAYEKWNQARIDNPPVIHPVVRVHPVSGRKALFVNEGFTSKINELPIKESDALLQFLFVHIARPEFTVRWHWQNNDLAFWDNRSTQHYASDDYGNFHRIMNRATVLGDVPV